MAPDTASTPAASRSVEDVLTHIRPAVRSEHPYVVDTPDHDIEVKLNQNESPYDLPEALKKELIATFDEIAFNRYPNEQPERLRRALADYTGATPEHVIVGNGSNELTYTFGQAFIEKGTPVVLPRPMFSLYEKVVRLCDGDLVGVPPRDDLQFDTDALVEAVTAHEPPLTVVTSPNNPTGRALPLADLERIVAASPGFVVIDEAYYEFNPDGSAQHLLDDYPNVILLRTLSKGFGLAGLRLGYLVARPEVVRELMKARLPFMVDRFAEAVGIAILNRTDMLRERVERMAEARDRLIDAMEELPGVDVVPSLANFVLFSTPLDPGDLQDRLAERGVLIRNMSGYDELPRHLRVNVGTADENKAFLAALEDTLYTAPEVSTP
jgi:histidinol-phosphate aminotransferase